MKKKSEEQQPAVQPQLTAAEYWEWRTSIEEMKTANLGLELAKMKERALSLEIDLRKLNAVLFKETLRGAENAVPKAKRGYDAVKEKIEKRLGMSLNDCIIDDVTYAVTKA